MSFSPATLVISDSVHKSNQGVAVSLVNTVVCLLPIFAIVQCHALSIGFDELRKPKEELFFLPFPYSPVASMFSCLFVGDLTELTR